ncbi:SPOR domain-containing protein [Polaribacter sp.]|nr:SPOR domain-containing protein [Polaribacter sp.]
MKNTLFIPIFLCYLLANINNLSAQNATNKSEAVQKLLDKKTRYNSTVGFGYSIQIYYGNETIAKSKNAKFIMLYPAIKTKLVWDNPDWKVQVGNYKTKLEADRANLIYKKEFSGTIVIPLGK